MGEMTGDNTLSYANGDSQGSPIPLSTIRTHPNSRRPFNVSINAIQEAQADTTIAHSEARLEFKGKGLTAV